MAGSTPVPLMLPAPATRHEPCFPVGGRWQHGRVSHGVVDVGSAHALAVLRTLVTADGAERAVPPVPGDDRWLDAAERHGVLATVAAVHGRAGHDLPARAEQEYWRAQAHALRTLADLRRVAATLGGAGVDWLLLKGPAVAAAFYPDDVVRPSTDLDVLVRRQDLERSVAALVADGAVERDDDWVAKLRSRHGEVSIDLAGGLHLDLHWHLVSVGDWRDRLALDTDGLFARAGTVALPGGQAPTPGLLDTVVHLGVHGCLSGGDRLRWLLDLALAVRGSGVSPQALAGHARAVGAAVPLWLMLERAERYLAPDLAPWRAALDPAVPARSALGAWSAAFPPGSGFDGGLSGTAVYLNGGTGPGRLLRATARSAVRRLARRPAPDHGPTGDAAARRRYYAAVRTGSWD